jgi:hypothetical protein
MRAVNELRFHIGGKEYHFLHGAVRCADVPCLLPLFMALTQPRGSFDVEGYVDEYALWHCFKVVE